MQDDVDGSGLLRRVFASLEPHARSHSLLEGRACVEGWPYEPAWEQYLLSLPEAVLSRCEHLGLHRMPAAELASPMPESMQLLCEAVASASIALGRQGVAGAGGGGCSNSCAWRQSAEKAEQVDALLSAVVARLGHDAGHIRRVVDVGCGKGHLTAKLQRALGVPALGLDFDATLIETAKQLYPAVTFEARNMVREGLVCRPGDLIVGLHPCGALGEAIVTAIVRSYQGGQATATGPAGRDVRGEEGQQAERDVDVVEREPLRASELLHACEPPPMERPSSLGAAEPNEAEEAKEAEEAEEAEAAAAGEAAAAAKITAAAATEATPAPADESRGFTLLMVPCCWHKQNVAMREPLSSAARATGLRLPTPALKKASMALDASTSLSRRRARSELRELLRGRGVDEAELRARREMDGIHPRKAARGLGVLAEEALRKRGLPPPTEVELSEAAAAALGPFKRSRRLSLLEPVLGELIELLCTLDRALALAEVGMHTCVFRAFDAGASDRNLALLAQSLSATSAPPGCVSDDLRVAALASVPHPALVSGL